MKLFSDVQQCKIDELERINKQLLKKLKDCNEVF